MGVRNLYTFLQKHAHELSVPLVIEPVPDPSGSSAEAHHTFLVDGFGLLITIAEIVFQRRTENPHQLAFPDADICGGDLDPIRLAVKTVVHRLREVYRVELVLALDAPRGTQHVLCTRDATWLAREEENHERLLHVLDYCSGKTPFKHPRNSRGKSPLLMLPTLLTTQLLDTLEQLGVRTLTVPGEVDTYLGSLLNEVGPTLRGVITGDTDFVVAPGVPVVFLNDLPWDLLLRDDDPRAWTKRNDKAPDSGDSLILPVFEHSRLAEKLRLSTFELLLAASLCGNDITAASTSHHCHLPRHHHHRIDEVAAIIRTTLRRAEDVPLSALPPHLAEDALLAESVATYQQSGDRSLRMHERMSNAEERALFESVWRRETPSFLLPLMRHGVVVAGRIPLLNGCVGDIADVPIFSRIQSALAAVASKSVLEVIVSDLESRVTRVNTVAVDSRIAAVVPTWDALAAWSTSKRLQCFCQVVALSYDSVCALLPTSVFAADHSCASCEPFVAVLLLLLRMCLSDADEMVMVCSMVSTVQRQTATWLSAETTHGANVPSSHHSRSFLPADTDAEVFRSRPRARLVEISLIFHAAYTFLRKLVQALRLDDTLTIVEPWTVFSGTVLHVMDSRRHRSAGAPASIDDHEAAAGDGARASMTAEAASVQRYLSVVKTLLVHSPLWTQEVAYLSQLASFQGALPHRVYSWAGVMNRDELVDALDVGLSSSSPSVAVVSPVTPSKAGPLVPPLPPPSSAAEAQGGSGRHPSLPIDEHMPSILSAIRAHPVVCIQGDTGCGKSSAVPFHLLMESRRNRGAKIRIVVTQPRRLAAVALAKRVASLLGEPVGQSVGYRLGGGVRQESAHTSLLYVTTGYFLEALVNSTCMWQSVTHLCLDEVHERSLDADMLSLVVKLMLQHDRSRRTSIAARNASPPNAADKRLILMSATIQADLFRDYFACVQPSEDGEPSGVSVPENSSTVPLLHVGKKRFVVHERYLDDVITTLTEINVPRDILSDLGSFLRSSESAVGKIRAFSLQQHHVRAIVHVILACAAGGTCILVFLPGLKEIEDCFEELSRRSDRAPCTLCIHMLHSVVDADDQEAALRPALPDACKVVLSTNIAETSITIPDVKYVVDVGFARRVQFDESKGLRAMVCGWCSKAAAKQRAGRAGRVSEGTVIRMYSRHAHEAMLEHDASEFMPLEYSVLQVRLHLGAYGDVRDVMQELVEPPPRRLVDEALSRLVQWRALASAPTYEVLPLGQLAVALPIDVSLTKAVMVAARVGCAAEAMVVACGLSLQRPLVRAALRPFFKSDYEFQQAFGKVWAAIGHFDRGSCNDLARPLFVLEETWATSTEEFASVCEQWHLSYRQVRGFHRAVSDLAKRVRSRSDLLPLVDDDADLVQTMAEHRRRSISFFSSPRRAATAAARTVLLSCVFCQVADRLVTSTASPCSEFQKLVTSSGAPPSVSKLPDGHIRLVVCPKVPRDVQQMDRGMVDKGLRSFGGVQDVVHWNDNVALIMQPPTATAAPHTTPWLLSPGCVAVTCLSQCHPSRKSAFGFSDQFPDGVVFSQPQVSAKRVHSFDAWRVTTGASALVKDGRCSIERTSSVKFAVALPLTKPGKVPVMGLAFQLLAIPSAGYISSHTSLFCPFDYVGLLQSFVVPLVLLSSNSVTQTSAPSEREVSDDEVIGASDVRIVVTQTRFVIRQLRLEEFRWEPRLDLGQECCSAATALLAANLFLILAALRSPLRSATYVRLLTLVSEKILSIPATRFVQEDALDATMVVLLRRYVGEIRGDGSRVVLYDVSPLRALIGSSDEAILWGHWFDEFDAVVRELVVHVAAPPAAQPRSAPVSPTDGRSPAASAAVAGGKSQQDSWSAQVDAMGGFLGPIFDSMDLRYQEKGYLGGSPVPSYTRCTIPLYAYGYQMPKKKSQWSGVAACGLPPHILPRDWNAKCKLVQYHCGGGSACAEGFCEVVFKSHRHASKFAAQLIVPWTGQDGSTLPMVVLPDGVEIRLDPDEQEEEKQND